MSNKKYQKLKNCIHKKKHSELFAIIAIEWNQLKVSKTNEIDVHEIDVHEIDVHEIDVHEIDIGF